MNTRPIDAFSVTLRLMEHPSSGARWSCCSRGCKWPPGLQGCTQHPVGSPLPCSQALIGALLPWKAQFSPRTQGVPQCGWHSATWQRGLRL